MQVARVSDAWQCHVGMSTVPYVSRTYIFKSLQRYGTVTTTAVVRVVTVVRVVCS